MDIHVSIKSGFPYAEGRTVVLTPIWENEPPAKPKSLSKGDAGLPAKLIEEGVVRGKAEEVSFSATPSSPYAGVLVMGCGDRAKVQPEAIRRSAGKTVDVLRKARATRVLLDLTGQPEWPVAYFVEGLMLGQYRFDRYKALPKEGAPTSVDELVIVIDSEEHIASVKAEAQRAEKTCCCTNWARDLANTASNEMTPAQLAFEAKALAENTGLTYDCLDTGRMGELGMNALLGVARGSAEPPRLIILNYHYADTAPTLAIVGKGITFDTGGVSIKPADHMHEMKFDMCGAAAVLGTMKLIAHQKPPINVIGVIPATENVVDARSQKPGDIVRAYNKKTIEVHNTDAEGRLILADAMAYIVDTYRPDKMVDIATLTGACVVALGHYAAGVTATTDALYRSLQQASDAVGERIWRLPLWEDYGKLMEGTHADLCNIGPAREAGAVTAACFLKEFVGDTEWAHIDIAGTAWGVKNVSYLDTNSATGFGVRLLGEWIRREAEN
ncbi:MAG: leucyl aminopeptidase, partial [Candidatus Hydrogenedentes bacterium]|nr:leucyl aminopeptidase [Candidatus Hydrogenedentota bacterium]